MKMEVAALVMGIIGLVCNFFGTGTVVGPICPGSRHYFWCNRNEKEY